MIYINIKTKEYPLLEYDIMLQNPNISIPFNASVQDLERLGYAAIQETRPPEYDPLTQKAVQIEPQLKDGSYYEQWEVVELTDDERLKVLGLFNRAKQQKIAKFKSLRDEEELSPVTTDKGRFDFDEKSLMRINEAKDILAFSEGATIAWTDHDNVRVNLSYADLMRIKAAGAQRSNELHIKYNELKARVSACQSAYELDEIEWEAL